MAKLYLGSREVTPAIISGKQAPAHYIEKNVDANGKLINSSNIISFDGVTDVGNQVLNYAYYYNSNITGNVDISDLVTVTGQNAMSYCFGDCRYITSIDISSLTTVPGIGAMIGCFSGCSGLTSLDMSSLTTVSGNSAMSSCFAPCINVTSVDVSSLRILSGSNCFSSCFSTCQKLPSISFTSLSDISGSFAMSGCFQSCTNLENIYFPALKTTSFGSYTNQFSSLLGSTGTTKTHTIHFPSNLESTIQGLTGYPLFGGTSGYVILAFDLPATE